MRPTVASWLSVISTQGDAAGPRSATAGASSTLTGPLMASLSQPAASGPPGPAAIPPGHGGVVRVGTHPDMPATAMDVAAYSPTARATASSSSSTSGGKHCARGQLVAAVDPAVRLHRVAQLPQPVDVAPQRVHSRSRFTS